MTTHRFREITQTARRTVSCVGCGKRLKRQRTFSQTVNPFNKNADGEPKTPSEIGVELRERAAAWTPDDEVCRSCEAAGWKATASYE